MWRIQVSKSAKNGSECRIIAVQKPLELARRRHQAIQARPALKTTRAIHEAGGQDQPADAVRIHRQGAQGVWRR
jgi:hypothetical protein